MDIFITGVSRGLGKALAGHCLERGHRVWGVARTFPAVLDEGIRFSRCDIGDPADVERVHREMRDAGFVPDGVILNAGIMKDDIDDPVDLPAIRETFGANLLGNIHWLTLLLPGLLAGPRERVVVNVSSIAAYRAVVRGKLAYPAAKAAMDMFFEGLRLNWGHVRGLRFLTVRLGPLGDRRTVPFLSGTYDAAARMIIERMEGHSFRRNFGYPALTTCIYRIARLAPDRLVRLAVQRRAG